MAVRYAENIVVEKLDRQTVALMKEVSKWERQADRAVSPVRKKKYLEKAQQMRQKALVAIEGAKIAAARRLISS